ncbi:uncharacterized protein L201_000957 [Kwoniella dendrophila CBS 6074]|uniref:Mitochondrial zinc maintenance protein 1, mitochondrial n=1 Tax=Kwoniella dendrophila CBS 6074 TaxID=1295534 RepID=A0AAX4JKZ9_9TREE
MTSRIKQVLRPALPPHVSLPSKPVKAVRDPPAIPFFKDPGHTIPTKWGLYRPLLRLTASTETSTSHVSIGREIRERWKATKGLTSVPKVRSFLSEYYELLDHLISDKAEHVKEVKILEHKLKEKHDKADLEKVRKIEELKMKHEEENNTKPKLTGSFHRPTLFNIPLPRMKPQPKSIGSMIHNRLRSRERRMVKRKEYSSLLNDMKLEVNFWNTLQSQSQSKLEENNNNNNNNHTIVQVQVDDWNISKDPRSPGGWDGIIKNEIKLMDERFKKENRRSEMIFDKPLLDRIAKAKERKKLWWKSIKEKKQQHSNQSS